MPLRLLRPALPAMMTNKPRAARIAAWAAVAVALAAVFGAYLNPHLMVDLATRVWACF